MATWLLIIYFHGGSATVDMFGDEKTCYEAGQETIKTISDQLGKKAKDYGFLCMEDD